MVSIDTEFPGIVYRPANVNKHELGKLPPIWNYQVIRDNVNSTKIIQLGLALCDDKGSLPHFGSACIETEEACHPRSLKIKHSTEDFRQATWTKRLKTEERGRDVQVKRKGDFQAKYPSLPHSMHCTNSTGHTNCRMTPEQYPHSLQHTLPPPAKP
ncbi:hypothetical protein SO802_021976 [Lithocarpus litseifolius]|uniref:poly(A)-specific ribonuclease n=1 Tax=Lithocarpus litseifolius TaxID=425828 RepID=A0AAW2CL97_9ROSI